MDTFKQEIIMICVTFLLIATTLTLLIMKIVLPDNPVVVSIFNGILYYWGLNSAYRLNLGGSTQPTQTTSTSASTQPLPTVPQADKTTPTP
jgi:hypothetical protein